MNKDSHVISRKMIRSYSISLAIYTAVKLSLFEVMKNSQINDIEISRSLKLDHKKVKRLLKFLESIGVVKEINSIWSLTSVGLHYTRDHPHSVVHETLLLNDPEIIFSWSFMDSIMNESASSHGSLPKRDFFQRIEKHPQKSMDFHLGWDEVTKRILPNIIKMYPLENISHITEIGGGLGALLSAFLVTYPNLKGAYCDKAYLEKTVSKVFGYKNLLNRVQFYFGDVFDVSFNATDIFIMKSFIHLFDDECAKKILLKLRRSLNKNGRILIIEKLIKENEENFETQFTDLMMLAVSGGRERTLRDFSLLFSESGFRLLNSVPLGLEFYLVEGEKND